MLLVPHLLCVSIQTALLDFRDVGRVPQGRLSHAFLFAPPYSEPCSDSAAHVLSNGGGKKQLTVSNLAESERC